MSPRPSFAPRKKARRLAMQSLYTWLIVGTDLNAIEREALIVAPKSTDVEYYLRLLHQVPVHVASLTEDLSPHASRKVSDIDPIERTILFIAAFELRHELTIPYRVIINEALDLAKTFGSEEGYKFVNAILDKLARQLRSEELAGETKN